MSLDLLLDRHLTIMIVLKNTFPATHDHKFVYNSLNNVTLHLNQSFAEFHTFLDYIRNLNILIE